MSAIALQDKTSNLPKQLARDSNSRLVPVMSSSSQNTLFVTKLTLCIPYTPYYKYPYTHVFLRASKENFEREILEKNKIDSSQSSSFDSPNSLTLTLYIDTSLRGTLAKSLSHHIHICEKAFWCLERIWEGTNSFWLMQCVIAEFSKLEKTRFGVTLLEQEALRVQVHWVDQA